MKFSLGAVMKHMIQEKKLITKNLSNEIHWNEYVFIKISLGLAVKYMTQHGT